MHAAHTGRLVTISEAKQEGWLTFPNNQQFTG